MKSENALRAGFVALLLVSAVPGLGWADSPAAPKVAVGIKHAPPFAIRAENGDWSGISLALWRSFAEEQGLEYEIREFDLKGLLQALEEGSVDVGLGALTMNSEREARFDFSHPFHDSGLGIAVPMHQSRPLFELARRLVSAAFLRALVVLSFLLFGVGALLWVFERRRNPDQFGGGAVRGLGSAFWWSAVTMTTVGYGDKAPKTLGGRLVALVWMFASIITISGITAAIASALTVQQLEEGIHGPEDLPQYRVGTVAASTSELYLRERGIGAKLYPSAAAALAGLTSDEIGAVVFDAPLLRHLTTTTFSGQVDVLEAFFDPQRYAIGLSSDSPLREELNRWILSEIAEPTWHLLLRGYLGE